MAILPGGKKIAFMLLTALSHYKSDGITQTVVN